MEQEPLALDLSGTDVHREAAQLYERGPAAKVTLSTGVSAWSITDLAVLKKVLADPRVSKDPRQHWPAFQSGAITPDWPLYTWVAVDTMFTAYGQNHRRLRNLVAPAFTHRRTAAMRPRVTAVVDSEVRALAETPADAVVDLRERYAYPVPIQVITELLGVPEFLRAGLRTTVDRFFDTTLGREAALANFAEKQRVVTELVAYRRENPGEDMTSVLIATRDADDGSQLTENELVQTLMLVISAGHETTVNLLDQAIVALLRHPEQREAVLSGQVSWSEVIEEALRFESPVAYVPLRYAVEDIDLDGVRIAQGEAILASYAAAGRDPLVHGASAGSFDVHRTNKDHLAFGHGVHYCLGASLARLEAEVALPALFRQFPEMRLAVDPSELEPVVSFVSNGHKQVPVLLRPAS